MSEKQYIKCPKCECVSFMARTVKIESTEFFDAVELECNACNNTIVLVPINTVNDEAFIQIQE